MKSNRIARLFNIFLKCTIGLCNIYVKNGKENEKCIQYQSGNVSEGSKCERHIGQKLSQLSSKSRTEVQN